MESFTGGMENLNLSLRKVGSKQQRKTRKKVYPGPEAIKFCAL
jgi:hypothetical protein